MIGTYADRAGPARGHDADADDDGGRLGHDGAGADLRADWHGGADHSGRGAADPGVLVRRRGGAGDGVSPRVRAAGKARGHDGVAGLQPADGADLRQPGRRDPHRDPFGGAALRLGVAHAVPARHRHRAGGSLHPPPAARDDPAERNPRVGACRARRPGAPPRARRCCSACSSSAAGRSPPTSSLT